MPRRTALFVALALAATALVAAQSLEDLCAGKKVELIERDQIRELSSQAARSEAGCTPHVLSALTELSALVSETDENLCETEGAQRVKRFYLDFVDTSAERERLPEPLQKFAVAFGMQLSNVCRWRLNKSLLGLKKSSMTGFDFRRIEGLIGDGTPLSKMLDGINELNEFLSPKEFTDLMGSKLFSEGKIYIQSNHTEAIKSMQELCAKRFEPIYERLITPVQTLASVGFNHQDDYLTARCTNLDRYASRAQLWARIVFLCEGAKLVEPVDCTGDQDGPFKLVMADSGDNLHKKLGPFLDRSRDSSVEDDVHVAEKDVVFQKHLENEIFNKRDALLVSRVEHFEANKTLFDQGRVRKIRRSIEKLVHGKTKAKIRSAFRKAGEALSIRRKEKPSEVEADLINKFVKTLYSEQRQSFSMQRWKDNASGPAFILVAGVMLIAQGLGSLLQGLAQGMMWLPMMLAVLA